LHNFAKLPNGGVKNFTVAQQSLQRNIEEFCCNSYRYKRVSCMYPSNPTAWLHHAREQNVPIAHQAQAGTSKAMCNQMPGTASPVEGAR